MREHTHILAMTKMYNFVRVYHKIIDFLFTISAKLLILRFLALQRCSRYAQSR